MIILQNSATAQTVLMASETLSDRLKMASLNTLLGMVIVFAVLILIIFVISLFKIIPYLQNTRAEKHNQSSNSMDNAIATIVEQENIELMNDDELIAVITAAIYASTIESAPADGLVVRSIRKIDRKRIF